jgi:hypothetical protein
MGLLVMIAKSAISPFNDHIMVYQLLMGLGFLMARLAGSIGKDCH